jgi:hypothetical protein
MHLQQSAAQVFDDTAASADVIADQLEPSAGLCRLSGALASTGGVTAPDRNLSPSIPRPQGPRPTVAQVNSVNETVLAASATPLSTFHRPSPVCRGKYRNNVDAACKATDPTFVLTGEVLCATAAASGRPRQCDAKRNNGLPSAEAGRPPPRSSLHCAPPWRGQRDLANQFVDHGLAEGFEILRHDDEGARAANNVASVIFV